MRLGWTIMFFASCILICAEEEPVPASENEAVQFPLPNPSVIGAEKFSELLNAFLEQGGYQKWKVDLRPRTTGPFRVLPSGVIENFGTHGSAAVKVCYSPQVWEWMQNGRKGLIPDGGMIIKLLYARNEEDPTKFAEAPTGFSIMVKDSKGSWDGWFYTDGGPLQKPTHKHAASFFDPNAGFALSCMNCHASADHAEGTFSSLRNVLEDPKHNHATEVSAEGLKKGLQTAKDIHAVYETQEEVDVPLRKPAPYWDFSADKNSLREPDPLPHASLDHVPQGPRPDGQRLFVTASNCMACHDAVQLYSALPNMMRREESKHGATLTNLSTASEWRHSMMGLSGRDPVFFAQLETERALHPELADQIDDKCLGCHAVMGARQWKKDHGPQVMFTHKIALAGPGSPHAKYGALSRDGISCMVCHQIPAEGLGEPKTFSGRFHLQDKPTKVFGPYEKAATLSMEQSLGLTPTHGPHVSKSALCASCHTIALPFLEQGKQYSAAEFERLFEAQDKQSVFHEQATYLEWKNSAYSTESAKSAATQKSCMDCHMQKTYKGERLRFRIANIEDETFPPHDHRAANEKLHLETRDHYSRHALHGINLFMLEMFGQNPWLLGIPPRNNLSPAPEVKPGFDVAKESALEMAQAQTAEIQIVSMKREANRLYAQVRVKNMAGHKFPTGVNFRRAFIEFNVQAGGSTLWASGATDEWGVIGQHRQGKFVPLKTEFFEEGKFQPHHETISREDQVQIYEELVGDGKGELAVSFLSFKKALKDNRLLPQGWDTEGPYIELMRPTGTAHDADYQDGRGQDLINYEIPIKALAGQTLTVSATLYYQALPPYYLRQRFNYIDQPATQRLYYLVNQLNLKGTSVEHWKLKISQDQKRIE